MTVKISDMISAATPLAGTEILELVQGGNTRKTTVAALSLLPPGYVDGLRLSWDSVTEVSVAAGSARDSTDTADIVVAAPLTAAITASGVDGLDTGAEAALTWYAVYAIADTAGVEPVASLLSASYSSPTLPAGYDVFRRVGSVRNDSGQDFLKFHTMWAGRTRRVRFEAEQVVIVNVTATTFQVADCSLSMPPSSRSGLFKYIFENVGAADTHGFRLRIPGDADAFGYAFKPGIVLTNDAVGLFEMGVSATQTLEVRNFSVANTTDIYGMGYDEEL